MRNCLFHTTSSSKQVKNHKKFIRKTPLLSTQCNYCIKQWFSHITLHNDHTQKLGYWQEISVWQKCITTCPLSAEEAVSQWYELLYCHCHVLHHCCTTQEESAVTFSLFQIIGISAASATATATALLGNLAIKQTK